MLVLAGTLYVAFALLAPFAAIQLPPYPALIPSLAGVISANDLITSILLYVQYKLVPSRAILVLASGYLFTALIVIPQALTFPGAFTPTGLLGAGLQSAGHLYMLWHIGSPLAVLLYATLKRLDSAKKAETTYADNPRSAISWSVLIVCCIVAGLTWYVTSGLPLFPFFIDNIDIVKLPWADTINIGLVLFDIFVLAVLWTTRRTVLDYWLMLVVSSMVTEQLLLVVLSTTRFSLGFYAGRFFSLATSIFVLVVLLEETTKLYARLARSNLLLQRERDNKLMNIQAAVSSIAHEIKQPLAAISANADAIEELLDCEPKNLDEMRVAAIDIVADIRRTDEMLTGIRSFFSKQDQETQRVDMNDIAVETLQTMHSALTDRQIAAIQNLTSGLPLVLGQKGQLREVTLNLIRNAMEALENIVDRPRKIEIITAPHNEDSIVVAVKDNGPGIVPAELENIFDPFVTTKSQGMGLGLALSRMFIERHGGRLTAFSNGQNGALLQFVLPIDPASPASSRSK